MKQVYYSDVSDTAPTLPATATEGFPQDGTVSGNAQATVPGAYWYYQVSSELENAIRAGGLTPDASKTNQLADIIANMHASANAVSYLPQSLSAAQKAQARANVDAIDAAALDAQQAEQDNQLQLATMPAPDTAVYPPTDCGGDLMNDVDGDPTRSYRTIQSPFVDRFDGILYVPQVVAATEATFMNAFRWSDDPAKRVRLARSPFWFDFLGHQSTFLYRPTRDDPVLFLSRRNKVKASGESDTVGAFEARLISWNYAENDSFSVVRTFTLFDTATFAADTMMEIALSPDCETLVARAIRTSDDACVVRVWRNFTGIVTGDTDDISAAYDAEYLSALPKAAADQGIYTDGSYVYLLASNTLRITTIAGQLVSSISAQYGGWIGALTEFDGAYDCGIELEGVFFAPYRGKFEAFVAVSMKKYSDASTFTRYDRYYALSLPADLSIRYDATPISAQSVVLDAGMVDAAGNRTGLESSSSWSTILRGRSNNDTENLSGCALTRYRTVTTTTQGNGRGQVSIDNIENGTASPLFVAGETRRSNAVTTSYLLPGVASVSTLGTAASPWAQLFAATTAISTSDERLKQDIGAWSDEVLDAWAEVDWCSFRMRDAVAKKGEAARIHAGLIAQRIKAVFEKHGLDAFRYGLLCHDAWGDDEATGATAGDRYSVRYEEALAVEAAYQRRRADRLEARIAAIEEKLNG